MLRAFRPIYKVRNRQSRTVKCRILNIAEAVCIHLYNTTLWTQKQFIILQQVVYKLIKYKQTRTNIHIPWVVNWQFPWIAYTNTRQSHIQPHALATTFKVNAVNVGRTPQSIPSNASSSSDMLRHQTTRWFRSELDHPLVPLHAKPRSCQPWALVVASFNYLINWNASHLFARFAFGDRTNWTTIALIF